MGPCGDVRTVWLFKLFKPRSHGFNITAFEGPEAPVLPTPIQNAVFQLTDVKVICQPTPDGYEAPVDPSNFLLPWATGTRDKKRKRARDIYGDDYSSEQRWCPCGRRRRGRERERRRRRGLVVGTRLRSPCRASCGRSTPLLCARNPPPV